MAASVCVLSFERLAFLKECLSSMMIHACDDFELIVHDDGSKDPELREWLLQMSNEGVISTLLMNSPGWNEGQGIAMNRMAAVAKGDPIIKCDQDLVFKPGWLKTVNEILHRNQNLDRSGCFGGGECVHPDDPCQIACEQAPALIGALGIFKYHYPPVEFEEMLIRMYPDWSEVQDFVGSFIAMPRMAWEMFGPWEERSAAFAEDNAYKLDLTKVEGWCCALTNEEFAVNQGFGIGPSTLVLEGNKVREIKTTPKLYEPSGI